MEEAKSSKRKVEEEDKEEDYVGKRIMFVWMSEAIKTGNVDEVREVLTTMMDVKKEIKAQDGPLRLACCLGFAEIVALLIEAGADVDDDEHCLIVASSRGHVDVVRILIEAGANISFVGTELFEIAKLLIEAGAKVNKRENAEGNTVLHIATINGNIEMIELLLSNGANPLVKNFRGKMALFYAKDEKAKEFS